MSAVDVLAVMDSADEWLGDEDTAQDLKRARAAVAELIEAVDAYTNGGHMEQFNAMTRALAKVQP